MRSLSVPLSLMIVLFMLACSKTNSRGPGGGGGTGSTGARKPNYAFANTEYNGTSTQASGYYQKPVAIRFNADSTVSDYSCFTWALGGSIDRFT